MGRLFWTFFFFFWLAQVVTSIGVGVTIWAMRPKLEHEWLAQHPPALTAPGDRQAAALAPQNGLAEEAEEAEEMEFSPPPHRGSPFHPLLMPLTAGSIVSVLFAALLAWYFARPIRSLRQAFGSAADGELDTRIGASMGARRDELADLGTEFDRMAERLQGLVEGQRRLLHDVSHELRSPLARLQAAADLMRQQPERAAELIERIERDTKRMDRLVGELLTLARLDAGMTGNLAEEVDLRQLLGSIAEDAHFEAGKADSRVEMSVSGAPVVRGSRDLIHRAVENVVRNALRYSPPGGRISIAAQMDGTRPQVRIDIGDEGKGVPEADLEAIFAPFLRSSTGGAFPGYGLGLAITRRIVEAHGGSVAASNRTSGGLLVTLRLPAANGRARVPDEGVVAWDRST